LARRCYERENPGCSIGIAADYAQPAGIGLQEPFPRSTQSLGDIQLAVLLHHVAARPIDRAQHIDNARARTITESPDAPESKPFPACSAFASTEPLLALGRALSMTDLDASAGRGVKPPAWDRISRAPWSNNHDSARCSTSPPPSHTVRHIAPHRYSPAAPAESDCL